MSIVLDVNVTPRGELSRTRKLRDCFMQAYLEAHQGSERITLDLAEEHSTCPSSTSGISGQVRDAVGRRQARRKRQRALVAAAAMTDQLHARDRRVDAVWNFSPGISSAGSTGRAAAAHLRGRPRSFHGLLGRSAVILSRATVFTAGNREALVSGFPI
jgi:hypothetical protein